MNRNYYAGLDGGSTYTKAALICQNQVVDAMVTNTGIDNNAAASALIEKMCSRRGINRAQVRYTMAIGYSRKVFDIADDDISEITAHAYGVRLTAPPDYRPGMIIDIGGQDSKIIYLDQHYAVKNFTMNDKCAAGTGRFLEVMANTLSLRPNEMFELARLGSDTTISSMCTVFAESEVIGLIGKGEPKENIAYAVVNSTIRKVAAQVSRMNGELSTFCLTGGLCECEYIREALSKRLGKEVISSPDARYAGAIGAALSAMKVRR